MRAFARELLDRMQPDPLLRTDAPSWMEVSLRTRGDELFVHFLNGNPGFDMSVVGGQDFFVDEIPEVGPYAASVRCAERPKAAFLEPGHKPLDIQWRDGRACFTVPRLKIHACVRLQGWSRPDRVQIMQRRHRDAHTAGKAHDFFRTSFLIHSPRKPEDLQESYP